ncbi:cold-shock protein CspD [Marinomonas sp. MED121]|uniref:cold shock domain-containing protein n=1 Tax=Marinomonas sp. MED121 TaxID=314277 RepID=UPI000068FBE2|nr:cold shock domain-containing protein [Marinomonas sp. MED121]EAQ63821.1 cold-shock protein CspD [Marinomonas sp. MED121]
MHHGTVKWFNNAKGYGFIVSESFEEDLFIHYSSILIDGYKTLKAGQSVSFKTSPGKQGLHAVDIMPEIDEDKTLHQHVNNEATASPKISVNA